MTIEKIIEIYNELDRIGGTILKGNSEEDTKYNIETIETLQSINVILHKYQKIRDIVMNGDDTHYKLLMQIKEVLEDGNNN